MSNSDRVNLGLIVMTSMPAYGEDRTRAGCSANVDADDSTEWMSLKTCYGPWSRTSVGTEKLGQAGAEFGLVRIKIMRVGNIHMSQYAQPQVHSQ